MKEGYEGDNFYVSQSVFEGGSEGDYLVFSASFYPDDLPRDDTKRMEKRMQHRKNAYMDAARR